MNHQNLDSCPMCASTKSTNWCPKDEEGFQTVQCSECNLIYVQNPWDKESLKEFYSKYYSEIHQGDQTLNIQREKMYELELKFLMNFKSKGKVLDVGCSGGQFLNHFKKAGFDCEGVEFGVEAAEQASKTFKVHIGEFPRIDFNEKYDVVVFRGCIEHVEKPVEYLQKAHSLLNENGVIFFTATPNRASFTCNLFRGDWNMHYPNEHLYHFEPRDFVNFFKNYGLKSFSEKNIYLESPYINIERDLDLVLQKIKNPTASIKCPPFFDNMMTVVFQF